MPEKVRKTVFLLDEEKCTGCGECVGYCIMKILEVRDGICFLTESSKCLECGFCVRRCPENAITLQESGRSNVLEYENAGSVAEAEKVQFRPVIRSLFELLSREIELVQSFEFEGTDIRGLDDFQILGENSFARLYRAPKLEKAGFTFTSFYQVASAQAVGLTPSAEHDFPTYLMDWTESEDMVFIYCDLVPNDDPGRNADYLAKYLYEPLEDIYQNYASIPGLAPIAYHWLRAISSPYVISGTIDKASGQVDRAFDCAVEYLRAWLRLYREARPADPGTDPMRLVAERKRSIRRFTRENDPAAGTLDKFVGEALAHVIMKITMP